MIILFIHEHCEFCNENINEQWTKDSLQMAHYYKHYLDPS